MHAPDRTGIPRRPRLVHPHSHARPGLGSQGDLPVDPGSPAPRVALRHLPHADQRVRPGPQHQLLQVPGLGPVLLPRRFEDPLPQPPYVLLMGTPVNSVPVQHALRSVHRHRRLTCPSVPAVWPLGFNGSPAHVSAPSRPGTRPGIRPVIQGFRRRSRARRHAFLLPFGHRHSLFGHPVPPGSSAPLTVGLPRRQRRRGPGRGFRVPHA